MYISGASPMSPGIAMKPPNTIKLSWHLMELPWLLDVRLNKGCRNLLKKKSEGVFHATGFDDFDTCARDDSCGVVRGPEAADAEVQRRGRSLADPVRDTGSRRSYQSGGCAVDQVCRYGLQGARPLFGGSLLSAEERFREDDRFCRAVRSSRSEAVRRHAHARQGHRAKDARVRPRPGRKADAC